MNKIKTLIGMIVGWFKPARKPRTMREHACSIADAMAMAAARGHNALMGEENS